MQTPSSFFRNKFIRLIISIFTILVGTVVLLGWSFDITILKSISPTWVSMKANTAFCFLLTGIVLLLLPQISSVKPRKSKIAKVLALSFSFIIGLVGLITLGEYYFSINLGIDELLFKDNINAVATSHPGRMAPDTAICFLLIAVSFFILQKPTAKHKNILPVIIGGAIILGLSLTSISAYLNFRLIPQGWMGLTNMAFHTAFIFAILGLEIIILSINKGVIKWYLNNKITSAFLFGIISISLIGFNSSRNFVRINETNKESVQIDRLIHLTSELRNEIQNCQKATILFAVSNNEKYKKDFISAEKRSHTTIKEIEGITTLNPNHRFFFKKIKSEMEEVHSFWYQLQELNKEEKNDNLLSNTVIVNGHALLENINTEVENYLTAQENAIQSNNKNTKNISKESTSFILFGSLICTAILILVLIKLNQEIGKRIEAEDLLKSNEFKFRTMLDYTFDWEYWVNDKQEIIYTSSSCEKITGYSAEEITKDPTIVNRIIHPEDQLIWDSHLLKNNNEGLCSLEFRIIDRNGNQKWISHSCQIISDNEGCSLGRRVSNQDITARKQAEEKYQTLFKDSPDAYLILIDGVFVDCNKATEKMLRGSREQIIGVLPDELSPEFQPDGKKSSESAKEKISEALQLGGVTFEWVHRRLDETDFPVEVSLAAMMLHGKHAIFTTWRDITERKRIENELLDSEQNFRNLAENSLAGIFKTSLDGNIKYVNKAIAKILEYESVDDVLSKNALILYKDPNTRTKVINLLKENSRIEGLEVDVVTNMQKTKTLLLNAIGDGSEITGMILDISKRKEVEAALQVSEKRFRAVIEQAPIGIVFAKNNVVFDANKAYLDLMHYQTMTGVIGKPIVELVAEESRAMLIENATKRIRGEEVDSSYEVMGLRADDTLFPAIISANTIQLPDGLVTIAFVLDLTLIKQNEELIKAQENFLTVLTDNLPGMVGYWTKDLICTFANSAYLEWFGKTKQEMIGIRMQDLMGEDLFNKNKPSIDKALKGEKVSFERTLVKANGEIGYSWAHYIPDFQNGKVNGFYVLVSDITELKKAEIELKEITSRLAMATRAGGVGVWDYDLVNNILVWDDQMFTLYGVSRENFGGAYDAWLAGVHPDDKERGDAEIQMAIRGEKEFDTEFRVLWADGSVHNIRALANVQRDDKGNPIRMVGTNWDITLQKQYEEKLLNYTNQIEFKNIELDRALHISEAATEKAHEMAKQAEAANKSKSAFLANMSHEIRTPLNAIIGFSQLMNREELVTTKQKEYNNSIIRAGEHLLALINDILELSKIESGRIVLTPTNINLNYFLENIELIFQEKALSKHLQFDFELAPNLPKNIILDENKLRQIFINLIGNAIKFTEEGFVKVQVTSEKDEKDLRYIIVTVQDSGPGISENELNKLFKYFEQTNSGIKKGSGTGLGLALSQELAYLMGGNITLSSIEDEGSTFVCRVQYIEGEFENINIKNNKQVIGIEDGQKKYRILVVDDRDENLVVAVNLLNLVGFETNTAVNGKDAIAVFESWNPDLILMDIRMPVMDGYEASRLIRLRDKGKKTPIVALTASTFENMIKIKELDLDGYIHKPFREKELFEVIGDTLGIKYIFRDDESSSDKEKEYSANDTAIDEDIAKLPDSLRQELIDLIEVADLDLFNELLNNMDIGNDRIVQYLKKLANNYDYTFLKQILKIKK